MNSNPIQDELAAHPLPPDINIKTIVSHADCGDGALAAAFASALWPKADVIMANYGTELLGLRAEPGMIFYDISPPKERAREFADVGAIVRDHHRSAIKALSEHFPGLHVFQTPGISGAVIAYHDYLNSNHNCLSSRQGDASTGDVVAAVGAYDTWHKTPLFPRGRDLFAGIKTMGWQWAKQECVLASKPQWEIAERVGRSINEGLDRKCQRALANASKSRGLLLFAGSGPVTSWVAETCHEDLLYAGFSTYLEFGQLWVVVSLRSKSDRFPCDAIAEKFGGGGHAGAGGFSRPVGRSFSVAKLKRELKEAMKLI